ncbi:hypothetical protein HK098_008209 [Nowakowskiella sp. JEL0407]|nr:hypothetical protein HK098_008209 [Nowakowskiella sp. JEL0407]
MWCCAAKSYQPTPSYPNETPRQLKPDPEAPPLSPLPATPTPNTFQVPPVDAGSNRLKNPARTRFPDAKVVVGVDFGTTFTGFSFIVLPNNDSIPQRVHTFKDWRDQPPRVASSKTPTIINYFLKPDGSVATHWGWTVDTITKEPQFHRVERCKLLLHESFTSSIETAVNESNKFVSTTENQSHILESIANIFSDIELPSGLDTVNVISDYLKFLFEVIKPEVARVLKSEGYHEPLTVDQYVFCFTVPVFWNLYQRNIMRESVFLANMISTVDSKNLLFCEEPVAGLLNYINSQEFNLQLPSDVLILDAGGGTVDLFQCKVATNKSVAELTQADGGFFGSTLVDKYFWEHIEKTIGKHAFNELWNNPKLRTSKIDFINHWDAIKRGFDENETAWSDEMMGGYKHINLSWELSKVIPPEVMDRLPSSGEIRLEKHHLKSFFDPVVDEIVRRLIKQLDASGRTSSNKLDALVLIGGFCNSRYLRDKILSNPKIAPRIASVPDIPEAESAVVKGAAWYAFDKGTVTSRKSRYTLGMRTLRPFNVWKDRQMEVLNLNDAKELWKVNRGFTKFVEIGESIYDGSVFSQKTQIFKGVLSATVEILKSDVLKDVYDMDDQGVSSVGLFKINLSSWVTNCPKWNQRTMIINVEFGELELWVRVVPVLQEGFTMSGRELAEVTISTTLQIHD